MNNNTLGIAKSISSIVLILVGAFVVLISPIFFYVLGFGADTAGYPTIIFLALATLGTGMLQVGVGIRAGKVRMGTPFFFYFRFLFFFSIVAAVYEFIEALELHSNALWVIVWLVVAMFTYNKANMNKSLMRTSTTGICKVYIAILVLDIGSYLFFGSIPSYLFLLSQLVLAPLSLILLVVGTIDMLNKPRSIFNTSVTVINYVVVAIAAFYMFVVLSNMF